MNSSELNRPAFFVLIIYPLILLTLLVCYLANYSTSVMELILFVFGYYVSNITVGIGLHRLWSHDSYKINKYLEFILSLFAAATLQGPALSWASNHFKHHSYTDTENDPHSPLKYPDNKWKGFWWSHMGWMLVGDGSYKSIDKVTMAKLGKNKILRFQLKYYWQISLFMHLIPPMFLGYLLSRDMQGIFAGFLFIGLGRAIQQHVTFFVNSVCHFFGTKKYQNGTAGDIWWLAILLLGENWHNFHHAFPSDYRNGAKWHHMDVHKWIIYLLSKVGLAWDLKKTPEVRVQAKVQLTLEQLVAERNQEIISINSKINEMVEIVQKKIETAKVYSGNEFIRTNLASSLIQLEKALLEIKRQISSGVNLLKTPDTFFKSIKQKLHKHEARAREIFAQLDQIQKLSI